MFPRLGLARTVFVSRAPPVEGCVARSPSGVAQLLCHKLHGISSPSFEPPTSRFLIIFFPFPVALQRSNSLNCCAVAQHLALDLRSSCFDDRALGFSIFFLLLQGVRLATHLQSSRLICSSGVGCPGYARISSLRSPVELSTPPPAAELQVGGVAAHGLSSLSLLIPGADVLVYFCSCCCWGRGAHLGDHVGS